MLRTLHIRNFALVDTLDISFETGLTVITGESGAGKSILLGALGMVMGQRADSTAVRPGADRAEITAEFNLSNHKLSQKFLRENSLEDADQTDRCLLRRSLSNDVRSRAFINSVPVTLQLLRQLTVDLIELHGQDENQRLTNRDCQLALVDDFGVDRKLLESCGNAFTSWRNNEKKLLDLKNTLDANKDKTELLRYQIEELEVLRLTEGEFTMLSKNQKRLAQMGSLRQAISEIRGALETKESLKTSERLLNEIADDHQDLLAARENLQTANSLLDDTSKDLRSYFESLEDDPGQLKDIEDRLALIFDLARKHRLDPELLINRLQELQLELETISFDQSTYDELEKQVKKDEKTYTQLGEEISSIRKKIAQEFANEVSACIQTLGIKDGQLMVNFSPTQNQSGLENVEFEIITNPKYPSAPLGKIASGGERSRISLAICIVTAAKTELPSLILDEADVGVGGTTADVIGRLLRNLANHAQVICVTHAPQVAALGQAHLLVQKNQKQDTMIGALNNEDRIEEVARMLAGSGVTTQSREYAKTLINEAKNKIH
ncbi:MAG: DNA repair protein RecN [Gammaproteobacteria bacterium]|nr:DNA repair protein RecN [Gammaproteobacteria bacterium]